MIEHDNLYVVEGRFIDWVPGLEESEPFAHEDETFTRSNGTIIARIYERLTKASRRRVEHATHVEVEIGQSREQTIENAYRKGVYHAFSALQKELEN